LREGKYYFDDEAADRVCRFFETYLTHYKGEFSGKPFLLLDWQRKILRDIFGTKRKDNHTRRYRELFLMCAKGNGKSPLLSGCALYLLLGDREPGAEIVAAANSVTQAQDTVFTPARLMTLQNPQLAALCRVQARTITVPRNNSVFKIVAAKNVGNVHGGNLTGVVFDEVAFQADLTLYDALKTSTRKRPQSLTVCATTAGHDKSGLGYFLYEKALDIIADPEIDETFYPALFCADPDDEIDSVKTWEKSNPSLGVSVNIEQLAQAAEQAKTTPRLENSFRTFHLNQWVDAVDRWLPSEAWAQCGKRPVSAAKLLGRECIAGLDVSSTTDITALVLLFDSGDGGVELLPFFWLPKENMSDRMQRDKVDYLAWSRAGLLYTTPGNAIDHRAIRTKINELSKLYKIKEIGIDDYNAWQLSHELADDGFTLVPIRQNFKDISAPAKELERLVIDRKLYHGANPILTWMAGATAIKQDDDGNIKPVKARGKKGNGRIDGILATVFALNRHLISSGSGLNNPVSVYETQELLII
jgi:phage terminase large subunit-like protein